MTFYRDKDGDQYGDPTQPAAFCVLGSSDAPAGFASNNGDCCDANSEVNPGAGFHSDKKADNCDVGWRYACGKAVETNPKQIVVSISDPPSCTTEFGAAPDADCGRLVSWDLMCMVDETHLSSCSCGSESTTRLGCR